jgi:CheY-like chemotaxis protein
LVKELVELHGGSVAVESGSAGTTVTATIPSREPVAASAIADTITRPEIDALAPTITSEQIATAEPDDDARGEDVPTLLVVDDSADLRGYIRDHFASRFRVLEAGDGAEGIALARRHLPDVVISDVMMPGTDGHQLVRALRASAETDFLSIVLLTAQAEADRRLEALEHGADEYIVKPFEMRELDVRVRNLTLARRRLRERFSQRAERPVELPAVASGLAPADQQYVARVRDAIQQGLADPAFGVGELAEALAQDRSRLFRRIKELFGESPSDLIRRMRVADGERLLTETSATVTDIAYAVGFNSLSYFCRCFQDAYGVTPAAYRSGRDAGVRHELPTVSPRDRETIR